MAFRSLREAYELTEQDCSRQIEDIDLESISRSHCKDWRRLPTHLEMDKIIISDIEKTQGSEEAKRSDFFSRWKDIRGSDATYKQLVIALLEVNCRQDAEDVLKILKDSICKAKKASITGSALSTKGHEASSSDTTMQMNPDTRADLEMQLDENLRIITKQYSSYVSCVRDSLMRQGVSVENLRTHLLSATAFNHDEQKRTLVSSHEEELERADDFTKIFAILLKHYSSFLNYEIFQEIIDEYKIGKDKEELEYPRHLEAYVKKHKISEFLAINPSLRKLTADTLTELVLVLDIEQTSELAKLWNVKSSIARILGLNSAILRIMDIDEAAQRNPQFSDESVIEELPEPAVVPLLEIRTLVKDVDVNFLQGFLCTYAYKWEDIGLGLHFLPDELKNIKADSQQVEHCLKEVLSRWVHWPIQGHAEIPTMERLCETLRSRTVGLGDVADQLYQMKDNLPSKK